MGYAAPVHDHVVGGQKPIDNRKRKHQRYSGDDEAAMVAFAAKWHEEREGIRVRI